jgi:hypothetical protein
MDSALDCETDYTTACHLVKHLPAEGIVALATDFLADSAEPD